MTIGVDLGAVGAGLGPDVHAGGGPGALRPVGCHGGEVLGPVYVQGEVLVALQDSKKCYEHSCNIRHIRAKFGPLFRLIFLEGGQNVGQNEFSQINLSEVDHGGPVHPDHVCQFIEHQFGSFTGRTHLH